MGNLQSVTDLTRLVQDVQYTTALRGMTEQQKQSYFNNQKQELVGDILKDREATFQKTFVDATRNNSIQHSFMFYQQRNRDLQNLGDVLKNKNETAINTEKYNNQLATRQYEVNEWSFNNKQDTLFVFQILFITLLIAAALAYLNKLGIISTAILGMFAGLILLVDIVILIYRHQYTKRTRNQRYWNKRQFAKKALPQASGICPPGEEVNESQPGAAPPSSS
jgi:hypothetical protein